MQVAQRWTVAVMVALVVAAGCNADDDAGDERSPAGTGGSRAAPATAASTSSSPPPSPAEPVESVATPASSAPATVATTSATPGTPVATEGPTTIEGPAPTASVPTTADTPADGTEVNIGRSVEGRPITAIRRGSPGGTAVLVVGVIHGDEDAGSAIIDLLLEAPVPDGIELWLVPSMNPDGQLAQTRQNANRVDLNRNFPTNWGPLGQPGDWQYAGTGPASEPETQAMIALSKQVSPSLTLWYHQDLFRINPATGLDGEIRQRYAELTGLPIIEVTGGTYTGTASQWSRTIAVEGGIGFTVELGARLSAEKSRQHADAVLSVAAEL